MVGVEIPSIVALQSESIKFLSTPLKVPLGFSLVGGHNRMLFVISSFSLVDITIGCCMLQVYCSVILYL